MSKTCLNCHNTFSDSDKACWNCLGMRFTRGVEYARCKTCNTELYRYNSKNNDTLYTNTCVLRSHFYCDKHDLICNEERKHPQKESRVMKVVQRKKK